MKNGQVKNGKKWGKYMIERIKKYKRYKDYYEFHCFEVKFSLFITVIIIILFEKVLGFFEKFNEFQNSVQQILLVVVGGEFTLLGMSLAGMAIITAMLSPEFMKPINKVDKNDTINRVLSHFEFSALNLGIQITYLFIVYFSIASDKKVIHKCLLLICSFLIIYHFFFNIFYIIALIGNCIKINEIKNICSRILATNKTDMDVANEIRIEYILAILFKEKDIKRDIFIKDLFTIVDKSNIQNKQFIKEYFESYYSGNKSK